MEKNFDMQELINITGRNAVQINSIAETFQAVNASIRSMGLDISDMKNDIAELKYNEEISDRQASVIREHADRAVYRLIGNDPLDKLKYSKIFYTRLYVEARKRAGLGSKIVTTKKGDFQRVINFIDAWVPSGGVAKLKLDADRNRAARELLGRNITS